MKTPILIFTCLIITISSFAQVNGTLSYQGYLTDDTGEPVNDGATHSFVFKFYNSGGSEVLSRTITSEVDKGLFSVIIGGGTGDNAALPTDIWNEEYTIGISVDGGTELTPRIPLTTVPYSFQAETANNVAGSNITGTISGGQIGTGVDGANITDGTIPTAKISGTIGIADGGTNATTEADARTNLGLAIGTNVQAYNAHLDDLSDGTLTGSKVGTGISATNVTTGTLSGALVGTGIDGANIDNSSIGSGKINGPILVPKGGTGAATLTGVVIGNGLTAFTAVPSGGGSQYLRSNAGNTAYEFGTLTINGSDITDGTIPTAKISGAIAIADGGTNATSASAARTNLGLAVGTNIQAYNASLQSISALSPGANGMLYSTGTDTYALTTLTSYGRSILDDANEATFKQTVNLEIGTDVQAYDADLDDLALDGSLSGSKVGTGISASNVSTGTLADARLESTVDISRLNTSGGVHVGGTSDPGTDNLIVDGTAAVGKSSSPATTFEVVHGTGVPSAGEGLSITNGSDRWTLYTFATSHNLITYYNDAIKGQFDSSTGAYSTISDRRFKKNIGPHPDVLNRVLNMSIRTFHFKEQEDSEDKKIGVIAQEVEPIFPALVNYSSTTKTYTVDYSNFGPIAIKAIQEQQQIIDLLNSEIKSLQRQVQLAKENDQKFTRLIEQQEKKIDLLFDLITQKKESTQLTLTTKSK